MLSIIYENLSFFCVPSLKSDSDRESIQLQYNDIHPQIFLSFQIDIQDSCACGSFTLISASAINLRSHSGCVLDRRHCPHVRPISGDLTLDPWRRSKCLRRRINREPSRGIRSPSSFIGRLIILAPHRIPSPITCRSRPPLAFRKIHTIHACDVST